MAIVKMNSGSSSGSGDSTPITAMPKVDINKDVTVDQLDPIRFSVYQPTISTTSLSMLTNEGYTAYVDRLKNEASKLNIISDGYKMDVAYNAMQILNTYNAVNSPDGSVTLYDLLNIVKGGYGALSSLIEYNDGVYKKLIFDSDEMIALIMGKVTSTEDYMYQIESGLIIRIDSVRAYVESTYSDVNGSIHTLNQMLIDERGITLSALREQIDAFGRYVSINFASLEIFNDRIATLVSQQLFDELGNLVSKHQSSIVQLSDSITLTVSQEEFNALGTKVLHNESQIVMLSTEISLRVTSEEFSDLGTQVSFHESKLTLLSDEISLRVTEIDFNELGDKVAIHESKIAMHSDQILLTVTKDVFDAMGNRVTVAESRIDQKADSITLTVLRNDFDELGNIVGNHTTQIQQNANEISLRATVSTVVGLDGRLTTAEGKITVSSDKISLLVTTDNVIKAGVIVDAINGGTVQIVASKINIDGTTTFATGYNPYAKSTNFITQPVPPYRVGDTWINGNELYSCSATRLTGSFNLADWYKSVKYTDDTGLINFQASYATQIADVQKQADKRLDYYFNTNDPSTGLGWGANEVYNKWYNESNGTAWEWRVVGAGYGWVQITDKAVIELILRAREAQDTADGKRRVFVNDPNDAVVANRKPSYPFDIGDLWSQGVGGDLLKCIKANSTTNTYTVSEYWAKAAKYTDDSALFTFQASYAAQIADIRKQSDKRMDYYFTAVDPSLGNNWGVNEVYNKWYRSSDNTAWEWALVGSVYTWKQITDKAVIELLAKTKTAQDTADGKRRVFVNVLPDKPTFPFNVGDLWSQGSDGELLKCIKENTTTNSYTISEYWGKASKYTDDTLAISKSKRYITTYFVDPVTAVDYDPLAGIAAADKPNHVGDEWLASDWVKNTDNFVESLGLRRKVYVYRNSVYLWVFDTTVIDGGQITTGIINADLIDAKALFSRQLTADNLTVIKGKIGNFTIDRSLTGTDGNNSILLDPDDCRIYLTDTLGRSVDVKAGSLTGRNTLVGNNYSWTNVGYVGTYLSLGSFTLTTLVNNKSNLAASSAYTMYIGYDAAKAVNYAAKPTTKLFALASVGRSTVYTLDVPVNLGFVHSMVKHDGRYDKRRGNLSWIIKVAVYNTLDVLCSNVSTHTASAFIDNNTTDTLAYGMIHKLQVTVPSGGASYYIRVTTQLGGDVQYQEWVNTTIGGNYWSTSDGANNPMNFAINTTPDFKIRASVGKTELTTNGFQSVWSDTTYFRIDGDNATSFIETRGTWLHNGRNIVTVAQGATAEVDLTIYATEAFVSQNYLGKSGGTITGNLVVNGSITQSGDAYMTHAEHVHTADDLIFLRDGATVGLAVGEYAGFSATKYDGTNTGMLVFDKDGIARVGDVGALVAIAARDEAANMTTNQITYWDGSTLKIKTRSSAFDSDKLGTYVAADYPRKAEAAAITGLWAFNNAAGIQVLGNVSQTGSNTVWDFSPIQEMRIGRNTNNASFQLSVMLGDGTANVNHIFKGVGHTYLNIANNNVMIGSANTPLSKLHVKVGASTVTPVNNYGVLIENSGTDNAYFALQTLTGSGIGLTVTNAGNVGISSNPASTDKLVVGGRTVIKVATAVQNEFMQYSGTERALLFYRDSDSNWGVNIADAETPASATRFRIIGSTGDIKLAESGSGNVLIGATTFSTAKLQVQGSIRVSAENSMIAVEDTTARVRQGLVKKSGHQPKFVTGNTTPFVWSISSVDNITDVSAITLTDIMTLSTAGLLTLDAVKPRVLGINNTIGVGDGISLYNGYNTVDVGAYKMPSYGMFFGKTDYFGNHGYVSNIADWAMYFTMSSTDGRGWIFRTSALNVASIDTQGRMLISKEFTVLGVAGNAVSRIHAPNTFTAIQRFVINSVTKWDIQVSSTNANLDFQANGSTSVLQLTTDGSITTPSFVSGFTGNGYKLNTNDNGYTSLTIDNLTVRRQMNVYELVVNQLRASNGSELITDAMKCASAALRTDIDAYTYSLYFDLDGGAKYITFVVNDIIRAQRFDGRNVILIEGRIDYVGSDYVRIRTFGYSNTPNSDQDKFAGLDFCRVGNTTDIKRQGFIYLTSSDDGSPYIDVVDGVVDGRFTTPKNIRYIRDTLRGSTANTGNHWVEIQAFNDAGTNVSSGIVPTSVNAQNATYPYSRVTDGDTASANYACSTVVNGTEYMLIDLGSVQSIATIKVWHYYVDGRQYNNRLEVSEDGITWHRLFDSDVSGKYVETSAGKTYTLGASKTKVRLGRLTGINDTEYGALTGYGLYTDNAYLKGGIVATYGRIAKWTINDTAIYTGGLYLTDYVNQYDADNRLIIGANYSASSLGGHIKIRKDATNYVEMKMNTSSGAWGINGVVASSSYFQLGSTNQIAGWNFNSETIYKDFRGNGSTVFMGVDNVLGAANTSVRGFGITIDSSNRIWMAQTATNTFELACVVGGQYRFQLTSGISTIAGWTFTDTKFTKVISTQTITLGVQTYATSWTGLEIGTSATNRINLHTDGTNFELQGMIASVVHFRLSTAGTSLIGGWSFNATRLYNGSSSVASATAQSFQINTVNSGSGNVYSNSQFLKGFGITWHQGSNAGHIVMGQVTTNATTLKAGYLGIQMMDHTGVEYFCLSAETTVSGSRAVYNRIAGWAFDEQSLYDATNSRIRIHKTNGIVVSNAATTNSIFTNANRVNLYYTSDTDWGLVGWNASAKVFQLGSTNLIAGCTFNTNSIFVGTAWALNADGSGKFASGKISWNSAGVLAVDGGVLTNQIQSTNWNETTLGSKLDISTGIFYIGGDRITFDASDTSGKLIRIKADDGDTGVYLGNFVLTSVSSLSGNEITTTVSSTIKEFVTVLGNSYTGTQVATIPKTDVSWLTATNGGAFGFSATAANITLSANTTYNITFSLRLNQTINTDNSYLQSPYDVYDDGDGAYGNVFADLTDGNNALIATSSRSVNITQTGNVTFSFNIKTTATGIIRIKLSFGGTAWSTVSLLDPTKSFYDVYVYGFDLNLQLKSAFIAQSKAGISEVSSKGFQVVKDATNYFRIDQTVTAATSNYIESYGKWEHNGAMMASVHTKATIVNLTANYTVPVTNTKFIFKTSVAYNITLPTLAQIEAVYGTGNADGYCIMLGCYYTNSANITIITSHYDNNGSASSSRALGKGDVLIMYIISGVWHIQNLIL